MPIDVSLTKIILMCSVTELANPQFAFSTNWNLYHRIFNSELLVFGHLKQLVEILGIANFRSWQSIFFLIKTTKIAPPKISHQQTWSQSPMHWLSAALDRNCQDAHRRCSRSAPPPSLVTVVALHSVLSQTSTLAERTCNPNFGMLLPPLRNPNFGTLLLRNPSFGTLLPPLRNPSFGTLLQPQFSRLVD